MPLALDSIQKNYISIQADVNARQAKAMAQFIRSRVAQGVSREQVIEDFQASIQGSATERGYVCIVDRISTNFLCHPMTSMLGQSVAVKKAVFDRSFNRNQFEPWEQAITNPQSGSGLLAFDNFKAEEVVHSEVIEELGWVVNSHENTERVQTEIANIRTYVVIGAAIFAFLLAFPISFAVRSVSRRYERQIEHSNMLIAAEQEKADNLLLNILPSSIARRMKDGQKIIVNHFEKVGILFCDIVNFTRFSARTTPDNVVRLLNRIFSDFDALCNKYGIEKIKTIGDAYMAVGGLPLASDRPLQRLADLALEMLTVVEKLDLNVQVRIGLHVGDVVAGVIGTNKFSYDLWGDAVNVASRLESSGQKGRVHVSQEVKDVLGDAYSFVDNGLVALKGKGKLQTWFLEKKPV